MRYDPTQHRRRSIRLRGYDYRRSGWYFLTICVQDRRCVFGEVVGGRMRHNRLGRIARRCWLAIPEHHPHVVLDAFVIMPNHVHGLIGLADQCGNNAAVNGIGGTDTIYRVPTPDDGEYGIPVDDGEYGIPTPEDDGEGMPMSPPESFAHPAAGSVSQIMRTYKGAVTRWARRHGAVDFAWQSRFHDHIVRNPSAHKAIRRYIIENPLCWHLDRLRA